MPSSTPGASALGLHIRHRRGNPALDSVEAQLLSEHLDERLVTISSVLEEAVSPS